MGEGAEHGLVQGLGVPIYDLNGSQAIVTFGATRFELAPRDRGALRLIAIRRAQPGQELSRGP